MKNSQLNEKRIVKIYLHEVQDITSESKMYHCRFMLYVACVHAFNL